MVEYLVTGGAGFIGSNIVEWLIRSGGSVRVIDNFATGCRENLSDVANWCDEGRGDFELIEDDVRDFAAVKRAVKGCRYVIHQAAIPSVNRSVADPIMTNEVNVQGTLNLLTAARDERVERFVFASSSSVYGDSEVLPKVETMHPSPLSPYALQKLTGEYYCRIFFLLYGLPTISLRYFNVFGPRQDPESEYSAVIPKFITATIRGTRPIIYGDGRQTRDFSFVQNVVEANACALKAPVESLGGVFNIGCGSRIDLLELLSIISGVEGRHNEPSFAPARPGDIKHSLADISKAQRILGFHVGTSVREGLVRTYRWYYENLT